MKRFFTLVLLFLWLVPTAIAVAEALDLPSMTAEELLALRERIDEELSSRGVQVGENAAGWLGPYHIAIQNAELGKDYLGKECLIVTYEWFHTSEKTENFMLAFSNQAFQDGIELELAVVIDGMDSSRALLDVKAGATLEVQTAFLLRDTVAPVEIEVRELFNFLNNDYVSKTFELPL